MIIESATRYPEAVVLSVIENERIAKAVIDVFSCVKSS